MTSNRLSRAARISATTLAIALLLPAMTMTTSCFVDRRQVAETRRTEAFDLYTQGQELERRGDVTRAIEYYSRAAELSPRPAFQAAAGKAHAKLGQHAQAIHYYDLALKENPGFDTARAERDLSLIALERQAEATPARPQPLEVADVLTDPGPEVEAAEDPGAPPESAEPTTEPPAPRVVTEPPPAPIPVAAVDETAEPADPAEAVLPGTLPPRRVRAAGESLDRDQLNAALFSHISAESPQGGTQERQAAVAASEAQRWDEATRRWDRIVAANSGDIEARIRLGDALQRSGRSVRAWEIFADAARQEPENPRVYREWGNSLVRAGELEKAAEKYRLAIGLDPSLVEVRNNLAAIDIEGNRAAQAVNDLQSLVAERPDFAPAWLNLAVALERSGGEVSRRIAALETYLRLDGARDAEAERWLVELRSARR